MIQLSYSTINMVYENSHNWVNKQMGLKPEDKPWYHHGKEAHNIIQRHVSGKELNTDLAHITYNFPIVEEKDFDERCKFSATLAELIAGGQVNPNVYIPKKIDEYNMIGFFDGLNKEEKRFLEIKSSAQPWSVGKFYQLMQRKIYSLAMPEFIETVCITCKREPADWSAELPKVYTIPATQEERNEALAWILGGIKIIESGDYSGGLTATGKCADPERCYYGINCSFR